MKPVIESVKRDLKLLLEHTEAEDFSEELSEMADDLAAILKAGADVQLLCTADQQFTLSVGAHESAWENRFSQEAFDAILTLIAGTATKVTLGHGGGGSDAITFEVVEVAS